ncbi:hypothetical protein RCC89_18695 [Cytophagaceae bacterium ABcell3]|nr:hypothetical protein RCC89_18695 [Cytophagaceae bacterium ABcell3]
MKNNDVVQYIEKLCQVAKEKALLQDNEDAQMYFNYALKNCQSSNDCLAVFQQINNSALENKEYLAYYALYKALDKSDDAVMEMFALIRHSETAEDINSLLQIFPDPIYHFLLNKAKNTQDKSLVACMFLPQSRYISDPDPEMVLEEINHSLDIAYDYWKKAC